MAVRVSHGVALLSRLTFKPNPHPHPATPQVAALVDALEDRDTARSIQDLLEREAHNRGAIGIVPGAQVWARDSSGDYIKGKIVSISGLCTIRIAM